MSRINISTDIKGTVLSVMMNTIKNLDPKVETLINLATYDYTNRCIMAVALHQQGITTFEHLHEFPFYTEFFGRFTYCKEKDTDVGTTNSKDIAIPADVHTRLHRIFLWCIHRKEDINDPESNNPLVWTRDELYEFLTGVRDHSITSFMGYDLHVVQYKEYINNKNRSTTNNNNNVVIQDNKNPSSGLLKQSSDHIRDKKKYDYEYPSLVNNSPNKKDRLIISQSKKKKQTSPIIPREKKRKNEIIPLIPINPLPPEPTKIPLVHLVHLPRQRIDNHPEKVHVEVDSGLGSIPACIITNTSINNNIDSNNINIKSVNLGENQKTHEYCMATLENINYVDAYVNNVPVPPKSISRLENLGTDITDNYRTNNMIGKNNHNLSRDNFTTNNINHHVQSHDTINPNTTNYLTPGTQSASAIKNILSEKVTSIKQLLSNAKDVQRLLDTTSSIDTNHNTTEHSDEQTLLSVMISSMNHMVTTAATRVDHNDSSNHVVNDTDAINTNNIEVDQPFSSTSPLVHLKHTHTNGESPSEASSYNTSDKGYLSLHTPIDGEFAGPAVHLENRDHNNGDNVNVINNMIWITSVNRPNLSLLKRDEELSNDDDTDTEKKKNRPSPVTEQSCVRMQQQ